MPEDASGKGASRLDSKVKRWVNFQGRLLLGAWWLSFCVAWKWKYGEVHFLPVSWYWLFVVIFANIGLLYFLVCCHSLHLLMFPTSILVHQVQARIVRVLITLLSWWFIIFSPIRFIINRKITPFSLVSSLINDKVWWQNFHQAVFNCLAYYFRYWGYVFLFVRRRFYHLLFLWKDLNTDVES